MGGRLDGSEILFGKRQAPKILKALDEIASEVNTKIRMRGISRGMVCVQEDLNRQILKAEHLICQAYVNPNVAGRLEQLEKIESVIKTMWVDVRYMLNQHTLTVGEVGVLSAKTKNAQNQLESWITSTKGKAMSGDSL